MPNMPVEYVHSYPETVVLWVIHVIRSVELESKRDIADV